MKLYAPKYYKNFQCIADKCEHSCCIGWEIDIDGDTFQTYQKLKDGYGAVIADSISVEDVPHFKLVERDRCPHLDGRGLCKIIMNLGKEYLCDICREHPRFYNFTSVAEVGIGMSCAEAARIILSSPDYAVFEQVGEADVTADNIVFDGRAWRSEIYAILQEKSFDYKTALDILCQKYAIDVGDDAQWIAILDSLEYLNVDHKKLFLGYSAERRPSSADEYLERFLAYLIYRHCTEASDADDFRDRLAFCLFCERLLASVIYVKKAEAQCEIADLARVISEEIEYSEENTLALTYRT